MHITPTLPRPRKPKNKILPKPQATLKQPPQPVRFAGGPTLETVDPNNLEQIQRLPASAPLRAIAMKVAPKTSSPLVMQYLAQQFKQHFNDVDYPVNPIHQQTLLHIAVSAGRPKLVEVLLNAGANPLTESANKQDALDWAETKMSRTSTPADRDAIRQMLIKRVKALSKQQQQGAGPLSEPAVQSGPDAAAPGKTTSWFSGWGLGTLFTPQQKADKASADPLPTEVDATKPDSAAPHRSPLSRQDSGLKGSDHPELAQLQQAQQRLQTQLGTAKETIRQLEQTTRQALQDSNLLAQEKAELETALAEIRERIARSEKSVSQSQTDPAQTIKRLSQKEESLRKRLERKTEALQRAEQTFKAELAARQEDLNAQQRDSAAKIAQLSQQLALAHTIKATPASSTTEAATQTLPPTEAPSGHPERKQDRKKIGKMNAKIRELQTELDRVNEQGQHLSEQLTLVQEQYRDWIARLLREKDSLNFQLAQTQWQRDESPLILPQVHQVNKQLMANMNHQGRELQTLRQTLHQQQTALLAQQTQLVQQATQLQAQAEIIQQQKAKKNTLSKTVAHLMALSTSHRSELQRQELSTYQSVLDLVAQKQQGASSEQPASDVLTSLEADLKTLINYRRKELESHTVLSTAMASLHPSEAEGSSEPDSPLTARRFPLRSKSFR
ncbi:hypothetical protein [Vampirovibrio chlorellavorus]|uniref:hypothetical protein n=1 Tax=Vampirovibrio chlorellavorus TaxID=758823 RepID=UPI0026EEFCCB|nr:hypothetical protein [Vampirovibrio chlorellavorus]